VSDPTAGAETIRAYDLDAAAYAEVTTTVPAHVRSAVTDLARRIGTGARVLEVGSGGGRDALLMESLGLDVRRTDVTPGFVALLHAQGHACDLLDPLVDDLAAPAGPYDAVWANASLLHVARMDLATVLRRLAAVTRAGGLLRATLKEGDGEAWSTHGAIAFPRHFTYWRAPALAAVVSASGWVDVEVAGGAVGSRGEPWLELSAVRDGVTA